MTHPFIKFHSLTSPSDYYEVRSGRVKRPYFDQTFKSHGYHCHALTSSHLSGWEVILPQDVTVIWDGVTDSDPGHVRILSGGILPNGTALAQSDTANATIAFNLHAVIETDKDHDIVLTGAPNYFLDGAVPMTAIIQSDWYHHNPLQYCWKLTIPNQEITFPAGMPFVFIFNRPKSLLENTEFLITKANAQILDRISNYGKERSHFYGSSEPWSWSQMYKNGVDSLSVDANKYIDHVFRPSPQTPKYEVE